MHPSTTPPKLLAHARSIVFTTITTPLSRSASATFQVAATAPSTFTGALSCPCPRPAAHPLSAAHVLAAAPAALLDPLRPRAPNGQRVARHTALIGSPRQPTPSVRALEDAHKDVAKRACSSWQELSVECSLLGVESCCNMIFPLLSTARQTPPRQRAQLRGCGKRHSLEHSPDRNTWESTLTAKLTLALPLILLLSNAVVLLDILPLLLLLHGMARRRVATW